jgi:hypothetical protein
MKGGEIFMTEQTQIQKPSANPLDNNEALAKLYQENANIGAENLGMQLPILKVHTVGRSENELVNGNQPHDGWFFYQPTQEQFELLDCHIMVISRGFRADGWGEKKNVFHQIMGGVIVDGNEYKPFVFYFTGTKLSNLWEFGKAARPYTKRKPVPIPMFAMTVRLTTEQVRTDNGKVWVVKFQLLKNEAGWPVLVTDEGKFIFLRDQAQQMEDMVENLVTMQMTESTPLGQANQTRAVQTIDAQEPEEVYDPAGGYNPFDPGQEAEKSDRPF